MVLKLLNLCYTIPIPMVRDVTGSMGWGDFGMIISVEDEATLTNFKSIVI